MHARRKMGGERSNIFFRIKRIGIHIKITIFTTKLKKETIDKFVFSCKLTRVIFACCANCLREQRINDESSKTALSL